MPESMIVRGLLLFAFVICGWSFVKGGSPERAGAMFVLANTLAGLALTEILNPVVKLTLDGVTAFAFVYLVIRYVSKWLGVVMLLYGAQFALNAYYFVMDKGHDLFFVQVNNILFLFVCISLAVGVVGHIRSSRPVAGAA